MWKSALLWRNTLKTTGEAMPNSKKPVLPEPHVQAGGPEPAFSKRNANNPFLHVGQVQLTPHKRIASLWLQAGLNYFP